MRKSLADLFRELAGKKGETTDSGLSADTDKIDRQQILSRAYLLQKRGKTLGSLQYRRFKIEDGRLFQESDKQRKPIELPNRVTIEIRIAGRKWNDECQNLPVRLLLQFSYRSPMYIYFSNLTDSQEVQAYVLSLMLKERGRGLTRLAARFKHAVYEQFNQQLAKTGTNSHLILAKEEKRKSIGAALSNWASADPLQGFIEEWQRLTDLKSLKSLRVSFRFRVLSFRTNQQLLLVAPALRVYVGGKLSLQLRLLASKEQGKLIYKNPDGSFTEAADLPIAEEFAFEMSDGRAKWKSQRMQLLDLWRYKHHIIGIPLQSSQPYPIVLLEYVFTPEREDQPFWKHQLKCLPSHYNVLTEVIGCQGQQDTALEHKLYNSRLQRHMRCRSQQTIFYWLRRFTEVLDLDGLISKCFESEPFRSMEKITHHRGTIVYRHFVELSRLVCFYDVQKMTWKHGSTLRRLLNALKTFDAQPRRINFTDGMYPLLIRLYEMVESTTPHFWNDRLFQESQIGRESAVFFLALVILRQVAPNYWSCSSKVRGISSNSLLFAYLLKSVDRPLWDRLSRLQINIEALFGVYTVSLLAELIGGQTFFRVLDAIVAQTKSRKHQYNLTLVGLFLALLNRTLQFQSPFESADSFLFSVKLLAANILDSNDFLLLGNQYIDRARQQLSRPTFLSLKQELDAYYRQQHQPEESPSVVIPKLYSAYSNSQHKLERVERTLQLFMDKVELRMDCSKLTMYLFQNDVQLLQHKFEDRSLQQLDFSIKVKLQSLSDFTLAFLPEHIIIPQFCRVSPRSVPSNCLQHLLLPLKKEEKYSLAEDECCYVQLRLIVKEAAVSQEVGFEPPKRYLEYFMDTADIRADVVLLSRYTKATNTASNIWNMAYSQLGWLNNSYLVPSDRLLQMHGMPTGQGIRECQEGELTHFFKVAKYSRCLYGRAIICNTGHSYFIDFVKSRIRGCSIHRADHPPEAHGSFISQSQISCYPLETVESCRSSYLDFYLRLAELPLMEYLTYSPNDFVELPELSFELYLSEERYVVIFTQEGDEFQLFSESEAIEIESAITFRRMKLRPKHLFRLPTSVDCLDNFLYYLRLNLFKQIISVEQAVPDNSLIKWPSRISIRHMEANNSLPNLPMWRLLSVLIQSKQSLSLQFVEAGKPRLKLYGSSAYLHYYRQWRDVDVLCQISSVYRYFLVEELLTRQKFIVAEGNLVLGTAPPRIRLTCQAEELRNSDSQLFKKLDRLF